MLEGKKILIGITGSIAAYKSILLVRQLIKAGAEVKVIMTPAARDFVSPLTLSTLSKNEVLVDLFAGDSWANHVQLGRWADVFLVAPLSCNTLAKMAYGLCDNLLLATYLSATCPVWVVPAMDEDMWHHPTTKENLQRIQQHGCQVVPVAHGELASGLIGEGRMAEPEVIVAQLNSFFAGRQTFAGKNVLITAGPTYEAIDPVRFIGNHSSGKMGFALAEAFAQKGASVTLVSGPVSLTTNTKGIQLIWVNSAEEMYEACLQHAGYDVAVLAAAVADYTPVTVAEEKIKKASGSFTLELRKTRDILAALGERKTDRQILVGFALETANEEAYALKKLQEKKADMIVLNSLRDEGAGFGKPTNKITIFKKNGEKEVFPVKPKAAVANDIVESISKLVV